MRAVYAGNDRILFFPQGLFGNYHLYLDAKDIRTTPEILKWQFESQWVSLFVGALEEGNIVMDVGAFNGYYSLLAARRVGKKGHVYAFEPNPHSYDFLKLNVESNNLTNNIGIYENPVSNNNDNVDFWIDDSFATGSHLKEHGIHPEGNAGEYKSIKAMKLDDLKTNVNVIKIDTEGSEYDVWKSMHNIEDSNEHLKLFIEMHKYVSGDKDQKLIDELIDAGFKTQRYEDSLASIFGERYFLHAVR